MAGTKVNQTMLIGLGGQGQNALAAVKRRVLDAYGEVPPLIKFLALDTAELDTDNAGLLEAEEFKSISETAARQYLDDHSGSVREWMDCERIRPSSLDNCDKGAGQVPQIGRFLLQAFFLKDVVELVLARLGEIETYKVTKDARWEAAPAKSAIVFFGSIAGGTGAGTLLDLACALRERTAGRWDHQAFLMLPGVFRGFQLTHFVEENGYAFLKQLDFFTSERDGITDGTYGDLFNVRTESGVAYTLAHPFDGITLVGNRTQGASESKKSYVFGDPKELSAAVGAVLFGTMGEMGLGTTATERLVNQSNFEMIWKGGKKALYRGIGIAALRFPKGKVEDYARNAFIARLVDSMGAGETATDADEANVVEQTESFKSEVGIHELGPEQNQILEAILEVRRFNAYAANVASRITKANEVEGVWQVSAAELNRKIDDWVVEAATRTSDENGLLNKVKAALEKKTDDLLTTYGSDLVARFLETLTGYFESVKGEMVAENKAAAGVIASRQTSIQEQKQKCAEATKKLFGKKEAIEKALMDYRFMLGDLAKVNGERIRTAQAIEFCKSMGATLADASQRLGRRGGVVDELEIKGSCALQDAKREIDRCEHYEFVIKPDLDSLPLSRANPADFFAWYREKTGKSSTEFWGVDMKEAWESINAYVETVEVSPALGTMTLASLVAQKGEEEGKDLLRRVDQLATPLLAIQPGKVAGTPEVDLPASLYVVAAPDDFFSAFPNLEDQLKSFVVKDVTKSKIPDPNAAYFFRNWGCVPAYALEEFDLLRNEYLEMEANPNRWSPHLDKRWGGDVLPDLDPSGGEDADLYVWALAVSDIPYLQRVRKSVNYYIFTEDTVLPDGGIHREDVNLGNGLATARAQFFSKTEYVDQCRQYIFDAIKQQAPAQALQDLQGYRARLDAELATADDSRKPLLMKDLMAVSAYIKSLQQ